jgi:hypothetical protein
MYNINGNPWQVDYFTLFAVSIPPVIEVLVQNYWREVFVSVDVL